MDYIDDNNFQVSVKGLFFNTESKLMMLQQEDGMWEPPGGRVQKGENLIECLKRECLEEMGLECQVLEKQPYIVYSTVDEKERARIMIFYKISLNSLDFKPSDECIDLKFYTKDEIRQLKMVSQIKKLPDFL